VQEWSDPSTTRQIAIILSFFISFRFKD